MYRLYKITYKKVGVVQTMYCVPQDVYDAHKRASALKGDKTLWNSLSDEERASNESTLSQHKDVAAWFKKGKAFTDESPIGLALISADGILRMPPHQGGDIEISIELVETPTEDLNFEEE